MQNDIHFADKNKEGNLTVTDKNVQNSKLLAKVNAEKRKSQIYRKSKN